MKRYYLFDELKTMKLETIEKEQDRRFAAMMRHCYFNHKFIHDLLKERSLNYTDFRQIDDWQRRKLPLIRKKDYVDNPQAFLINPKLEWNTPEDQIKNLRTFYKQMGCFKKESRFLLREGIKYILTGKKSTKIYDRIKQHAKDFYYPYTPIFSGGRTAQNPSASLLTKSDIKILQNNSANIGRLVWDPYYKRGIDLIAQNLFPYAPHLGFWGVHLGFEAMATVNLPTAAGGTMTTDKLVTLAQTFGSNGFAGIPSYVKNRFIEVAKEMNYKAPREGAILLAGERIYRRAREDIKTAFESDFGMRECRVVGGYASSETKIGFFGECNDDSGYHNTGPFSMTFRIAKLNSDDMTDYEFVGPDESGLITLFHLDGTGTIFEGFLQGDTIGSVIEERCDYCGLPTKRLVDISRSHETDFQMRALGLVETKVKGSTVNLTSLRESLMSIEGLREIQLVIDKENGDSSARDILVVRASRETDELDEALHNKIMEITKREGEIKPHVEFIDHDQLMTEVEALKYNWISDLRAKYSSQKPES